ncbi:MAG: hypothetical protein KF838_04290 [Phycisphaeraceae bacterium]|nr:MAG: hypothetical protein KF838_04290 [Phycisphaeraceae bacterium]
MSDTTSQGGETPALNAEVERILRAGQRLGIAMVFIAIVVVDLGIVANADFGTRNQTVFRCLLDMLSGRGGPSFRLVDARLYATPDGVRIVSGGGTDMERVAAETAGVDPDNWNQAQAAIANFPPAEWQPIAVAGMLSSRLYTNGYGFLTPAHQIVDYSCFVQSTTMQPLTGEQTAAYREMFCDWLATESDWASPQTAKYAAELKKGDRTVTRIVWPFLVHDAAALVVLAWSGWTILRTPLPTLARARRINRGHCPRCSYDLLADFSRGCPECAWGKERGGTS